MLGQADDLGGGIFKKRLDRNRHRSIILAKGGRSWIYAYLFAKNDRTNIDDHELMDWRRVAGLYAGKTDADIVKEVHIKELVEICHD